MVDPDQVHEVPAQVNERVDFTERLIAMQRRDAAREGQP